MSTDVDEAIMRAARTQVVQMGIRRTTMSSVARGAKISRPTLYARFSGKDALISKLLTHELLTVVAEGKRLPDTGSGFVEALMDAARAVASNEVVKAIVEEQPELLGTYFFRRLGESQVRIIGALERKIAQIQRNAPHTICHRDPHAAATMCCSVLQHFAISARIFDPVLRAQRSGSTWDQELQVMLEGYLLP
ncbi:TetR/AcrR family transcriptional regulator [Corynebacterium pelargi]|uniref:Transcriptional regulator, TetR family n=1 Tax=Corynebacterium pelargi TaxID=1471400 RepID=A0A410WAY4_9CORY|nr:TetR/AcrR family transcriptional regulator [Corynebacterium pelargi]QAU53121.1 Transcriptional regulator, TetR family [Corynebacterium pelargi]GGG74753.1 TetR family transcriptional regulator [Corynebacterium pelargi]